jgi:hypothetical protein
MARGDGLGLAAQLEHRTESLPAGQRRSTAAMPKLHGGRARDDPQRTDPPDCSRNVTTITDAGRNRLEEFDKILPGIQDWLLVASSPAERIRLVGLLNRVLNSRCRGRNGAVL